MWLGRFLLVVCVEAAAVSPSQKNDHFPKFVKKTDIQHFTPRYRFDELRDGKFVERAIQDCTEKKKELAVMVLDRYLCLDADQLAADLELEVEVRRIYCSQQEKDPCGGLTFANETVYAIYAAFNHRQQESAMKEDLRTSESWTYFGCVGSEILDSRLEFKHCDDDRDNSCETYVVWAGWDGEVECHCISGSMQIRVWDLRSTCRHWLPRSSFNDRLAMSIQNGGKNTWEHDVAIYCREQECAKISIVGNTPSEHLTPVDKYFNAWERCVVYNSSNSSPFLDFFEFPSFHSGWRTCLNGSHNLLLLSRNHCRCGPPRGLKTTLLLHADCRRCREDFVICGIADNIDTFYRCGVYFNGRKVGYSVYWRQEHPSLEGNRFKYVQCVSNGLVNRFPYYSYSIPHSTHGRDCLHTLGQHCKMMLVTSNLEGNSLTCTCLPEMFRLTQEDFTEGCLDYWSPEYKLPIPPKSFPGFALIALTEVAETELVLASGQIHYCDTLPNTTLSFTDSSGSEFICKQDELSTWYLKKIATTQLPTSTTAATSSPQQLTTSTTTEASSTSNNTFIELDPTSAVEPATTVATTTGATTVDESTCGMIDFCGSEPILSTSSTITTPTAMTTTMPTIRTTTTTTSTTTTKSLSTTTMTITSKSTTAISKSSTTTTMIKTTKSTTTMIKTTKSTTTITSHATTTISETTTTTSATPKMTTATSATTTIINKATTSSLVVLHPGLATACNQTDSRGEVWSTSACDVVVHHPCPPGSSGTATWICSCEQHSFTPDQPDRRNCTEDWLGNIEDQIAEGDPSLSISADMVDSMKSSGDITSGGLLQLATIMPAILALHLEEVANGSVLGRHNFTANMVTVLNSMFGSETAWLEIPDIVERHHLSSDLLLTLEDVGDGRFEHEEQPFTQDISLGSSLSLYLERGRPQNALRINLGTDEARVRLPKLDTKAELVNMAVYVLSVANRHVQYFPTGNRSSLSPVVGVRLNQGQLTNLTGSPLELRYLLQRPVRRPACVYWAFQQLPGWNTSGCDTEKYRIDSGTEVTCTCHHLTNFAVIFDISGVASANDVLLENISFVLGGVSIICLLLNIIVETMFGSGVRSVVETNRSFCFMFGLLILLYVVDVRSYDWAEDIPLGLCSAIGSLNHYIWLAGFSWTGVEGFLLYRAVVTVFDTGETKRVNLYLFGYGVPLILVSLTVIASLVMGVKDLYTRNPAMCWLTEEYLLAFVIPVTFTILLNTLVFIRVFTVACRISASDSWRGTRVQRARSWARNCVLLTGYLGLHWLAGFYFTSTGLQFLFVLLNTSLGVFIFAYNVLLNRQMREKMWRAMAIRRHSGPTASTRSKSAR